MDNKALTLKELQSNAGRLNNRLAVVGLDGFVDKIIHPVDKRHGPGDAFERIKTITDFAGRIGRAAGKSANIELAPVLEKLGGNGPIMANALLSLGLKTRYIGALGQQVIHPIFEAFARATDAISLTDPGVTHACEFNDGKILLGSLAPLEKVTYDRIIEVMGEGPFLDLMSRGDLIALTNWTMLPYMTELWNTLTDQVLPNLNRLEGRQFFFDLADPEKRSTSDLQGALQAIKRFQSFGNVTLGLNFKEGQQVDALLGNAESEPEPDQLKAMATRIRNALGITCVVVHPTRSAACATKEDAYWVEGPFTDNPKITTGAGDHFNAGFCTGRLLGLSPLAALTVAVSTSGSYVRTGQSPNLSSIQSFISGWK
ncbi:MAG: PfkB family carbohydrate kinase [Opitutales bacterium]